MKRTNKSLLSPDESKIVMIDVNDLGLDPENPRLSGRGTQMTQHEIVRSLWSEMAVDEVAWSIATNGFFRSEPLFIIANIAEPRVDTPYIVVEGNRRLCAVMLLLNDDLRKSVRATNLPRLTEEKRSALSQLPVVIYESRETLWTTIGFRHVNGIKPWDSFSKAKYIAEVHESYRVPLDEIAERIGDRNATVKRIYRGYKVLQQAEEKFDFVKQSLLKGRFYFSHLYTATDQREYQEFLGIDPDRSLTIFPVPEDKIENLRDLMIWLYGNENGEGRQVKTQNPDLNRLRTVVGDENAVEKLRAGLSLEEAYNISIGEKNRLRDAITKSFSLIREARRTVSDGYNGEEDLFDYMLEIVNNSNEILELMEISRKNTGTSRKRYRKAN